MALDRRREGKRNRKHLAQCAKIRNPNPLEMFAGYSVVVWVGLLILLSTLEQGFSVTKHWDVYIIRVERVFSPAASARLAIRQTGENI